jgi:quinol monooxygenase YgiN
MAMYGTVARMQLKPGRMEDLQRLSERQLQADVPGAVFSYVYQTDADPNVCYLAVGFESKDAYLANARSPEQNERYMLLREYLAADPEWHDGQIVQEYVRER